MQSQKQAEYSAEALSRAQSGQSWSNFPAIFEGLMAKGILADDIKPRENVFTFNAWKALGRCVKRGEHGVRVCTFVEGSSEDKETGEQKHFRMPRSTTVFHISQTKAIGETEAQEAPAPKPAAQFKPEPKRAAQSAGDRWLEE